MGIFSFLFGRRGRANEAWLVGDGSFEFEIVGELNYQEALEAICGGRGEASAKCECIAHLVPEPANPRDRNAIAIRIVGRTVGYLDREKAVAFGAFIRAARIKGRDIQCGALIVGGWERGRSKGHFGVKLDLKWPFEIEGSS
jgi:hypothetical protein